ncbi:hypothetical protein ACU686_01470 [Yinghuangia aomiensis]
MTLSTTDSLAVYLASLSAPDLARVVTTAPTVPEEPRPRTLRHLAVCLADPETALLGCSFLSRGELQLLEVLWAVADERPPGGAARLGRDAGPRLDDDPVVVVDPDVVLALVGGPGTAEARELGPALDTLTGRVLAWPEDGRIRLHPGAASVFPLPLGLGAPAYPLLLGQRADDLRTIVRELGGLPAGRKDHTTENAANAANAALAARLLGDPDVVRRVASRLDPPARAALDELAEIGIRRDPSAAWGYYGTRPGAGDPLARLRLPRPAARHRRRLGDDAARSRDGTARRHLPGRVRSPPAAGPHRGRRPRRGVPRIRRGGGRRGRHRDPPAAHLCRQPAATAQERRRRRPRAAPARQGTRVRRGRGAAVAARRRIRRICSPRTPTRAKPPPPPPTTRGSTANRRSGCWRSSAAGSPCPTCRCWTPPHPRPPGAKSRRCPRPATTADSRSSPAAPFCAPSADTNPGTPSRTPRHWRAASRGSARRRSGTGWKT